MAASEIEVTAPVDASIDDIREEGKTIFAVLAGAARERSKSELRTTAIGCAVNAGLIFVYHPRLSWLASAFVAASMYGMWGLADRVARNGTSDDESRIGAHLMRMTSVAVGTSAALWGVLRLMQALLGPGLWH